MRDKVTGSSNMKKIVLFSPLLPNLFTSHLLPETFPSPERSEPHMRFVVGVVDAVDELRGVRGWRRQHNKNLVGSAWVPGAIRKLGDGGDSFCANHSEERCCQTGRRVVSLRQA
eukprot:751366-Hanusia_phi.AAC.2